MVVNMSFGIAPRLTTLQAAELIRAASVNDTDEYLFKHGLVQDTAYKSLLKTDRKRLHRAVGEALEQIYPTRLDENAARLVDHFAEAGDDTKTFAYALRAGDRAAQVYALPEAISFYARACQLAAKLSVPREQIIYAFTRLGRSYELRDSYEHASQTYNALRALGDQRQDAPLQLAALMAHATLHATPTPLFDAQQGQSLLDQALHLARELNDKAAQTKILWNFLLLNGFSGNAPVALQYGEQALASARELGSQEQLAYILNDIAPYGYTFNGRLADAQQALDLARELWQSLGNLAMLGDNLNHSALIAYMTGDFERGMGFAERAYETCSMIENAWGVSLAMNARATLNFEFGQWGLAVADFQEAYTVARTHHYGVCLLPATNLALLYAEIGQAERGLETIRTVINEFDIRLYRPMTQSTLAYLYWLTSEHELALDALRNADIENPEKLSLNPLPGIRAQGEIGLARGEHRRIADYMERAAERIEQIHMVSILSEARLYQARALWALGDAGGARAAFQAASDAARRIDSRRALLSVLTVLQAFETELGNTIEAQSRCRDAREQIDFIAATLPADLRAAFLNQYSFAEIS